MLFLPCQCCTASLRNYTSFELPKSKRNYIMPEYRGRSETTSFVYFCLVIPLHALARNDQVVTYASINFYILKFGHKFPSGLFTWGFQNVNNVCRMFFNLQIKHHFLNNFSLSGTSCNGPA